MKTRFAFAFALAVSAAACGGGDEPASTASTPEDACSAQAPYAKAGPYAAGVTTIDVGGVKVEVWYPAEKGAEAGKKRDVYDMRDWLPADQKSKVLDADRPFFETSAYRDLPPSPKGKFPIVLFSHGLGGYRTQSSFLTSHLATWGFVVVAPDHVERGLAVVLGGDPSKIEDKAPEQLRAALAFMKTDGGKLKGLLDLAHVAVSGHSQGGAAVSTVLEDAEIGAGVFLASPGFGESPAGKSILMGWGTADRVAKESAVLNNFDKQPAGARGVAFRGIGHMGFTDLCRIAEDKGGVLQLALDRGIAVDDLVKTLASDGCGKQPDGSEYLAIEKGWEVIDHYVTAQLRAAFGIDPKPVGLDATASQCFGDRVAKLQVK